MASKLSLVLAELKRRKVTHVAVMYALVGLGVIEGAQMILPTLQLEAGYPYIVIFVLFGFPIALVLAWAYEMTPEGLKRENDADHSQLKTRTANNTLYFTIIGLLVASLTAKPTYSVPNRIARESIDPSEFSCDDPDGCRYSDAAIADLETGIEAKVGFIARTVDRNADTLEVDEGNPLPIGMEHSTGPTISF